MSSAFQVECLLIKISKKIGVLLMKMTILPMAAKNELKILLMEKAVRLHKILCNRRILTA